jgi:predicted nucleic acid-binding protein
MAGVLLDTGVWFGYFDKNDVFHRDADELMTKLLAEGKKILLSEVGRFELLNALTHELLNHERVRQIENELFRMSPHVEIRYSEKKFWDEVLPANFPRLFLKPMDFIIASCALYWEVEAFYSFDEKLNIALRRIKPDIVKLKIKRGRVVKQAEKHK